MCVAYTSHRSSSVCAAVADLRRIIHLYDFSLTILLPLLPDINLQALPVACMVNGFRMAENMPMFIFVVAVSPVLEYTESLTTVTQTTLIAAVKCKCQLSAALYLMRGQSTRQTWVFHSESHRTQANLFVLFVIPNYMK